METARPEYEFLDLSDVKEAELSRLECALFERPARALACDPKLGWAEPLHELSSCSSSTAGAATVSSSLDSLSGGEGDMAPHSPQRSAPPAAAPPPHLPAQPPPYAQPPPPPPYPHPHPPPHHQQWPVVPPNVYVSQVTANVNVHGYMGQYYQPPQGQYAPPPPQPGDRQPRGVHRRERRGKRGPSPPPPQPPPPYYVPYPQYYPAAQAQGAPLYHLPVYQPVTYMGSYPYASYYPEYPMPVEEGEKGPEEQYPQEMMMEQEAVDAYFAGAHYAPGPPYTPQPDSLMEYVPPVYLPPPPHHQPLHVPHPPPHYQPTPHQFNVHAKNFVQNQNHTKNFTPLDVKPQEQKPPVTSVPIASVSVAAVDALPVKELKIATKEPTSPKMVTDAPTESPQAKRSPVAQNDKVPLKGQPQAEPQKHSPIINESKPDASSPQTVKSFPSTGLPNAQTVMANKVPPNPAKITKGPAAPFTGGKPLIKTTPIPQTAIPTQQPTPAPKAPFANRQRRDGASARSPDNAVESTERNAPIVEHPKREPPLPPSKAPMPISISLNTQGGAPLIISNKSPFAHSRKAALVATPEPPPVPQPPPPAPTASDFPPPPTPRNRGEPTPAATPLQQPSSAQEKSWASLFASNKSLGMSVSSISLPVTSVVPEEPVSPVFAAPVPVPNVQKPVAKVPPYDASPLAQSVASDKSFPLSRPSVSMTSVISYSEKTSASVTAAAVKPVSPAQPTPGPVAPTVVAPEVREAPPAKEPIPPTPVQPSPFADDPNSYRMGEFLSKYQLDNRTVSLLPRGLTNRSNFCYVNAILQALIACAPFYNMLKALPYQTRRGKSSTPVIDAMVELCYEFTPLASNGRVSRARGAEGPAAAGAALPIQTGPPLDPAAGQKVLRALRPFPGSQEGRQEDAEEFLGCLLNGLNDEMLELMKLVEPEEPKEPATANGAVAPEPVLEDDEDDDEWKVMGPKNKGAIERSWGASRTPLSDIFRGRTRCRLHRTPSVGHHTTDAVQPFFTLQLDIERANSVKEALELLAGRDQLEGVTAGGARVVDAWQQLSLEQLPVVLLLHLKCFQLDADGHTAKIVKCVDFPVDLKIDAKIMSSKIKHNSRQRMYKLYAVVYHEGVEAVKGHYLTDTLHGQAGWIRYDDSTVTLVSEAQVLKPKAPRMPYLLMYRRQDTLPVPPPQHRSASKAD